MFWQTTFNTLPPNKEGETLRLFTEYHKVPVIKAKLKQLVFQPVFTTDGHSNEV